MKRIVTFSFVVFVVFVAVDVRAQFGVYVGRVVAEWDTDGRHMILRKPFAYVDPFGVRWEAPEGSRVDGASIPQIAWSFIGAPFEGKYRDASVLHDVACVERKRPWWDVHDMFYTGMLASGVDPVKAKIMYSAVYHFGPRWRVPSHGQEGPNLNRYVKGHGCVVGQSTICTDSVEEALASEGRLGVPAAQVLSSDAFSGLAKEIQAREDSAAGSMTLAEIRTFR